MNVQTSSLTMTTTHLVLSVGTPTATTSLPSALSAPHCTPTQETCGSVSVERWSSPVDCDVIKNNSHPNQQKIF